MIVLVSVGCADDAKKSTTDPNNGTNNGTNNKTNNTNNGTNSLTVDISDDDQTCDLDGECALVSPRPCGCACPETGINKNDLASFNTALDQITCPEPAPDCAACQEMVASCWESTCYAREPIYVEADDYDTSCESADDCMYIVTGEICNDCQCPSAPVNRADYEAKIPTVECNPGPSPCDCEIPPPIVCNAGVCEMGD